AQNTCKTHGLDSSKVTSTGPWRSRHGSGQYQQRLGQFAPVVALGHAGLARAEQLDHQLTIGVEGLQAGDHTVDTGLAHTPQLDHATGLQMQVEIGVEHIEPAVHPAQVVHRAGVNLDAVAVADEH